MEGKCYKIEFSYQTRKKIADLDSTKYLAIDLGIDNFATIVDNATGTATILDGKYLKSINWWYNKRNAKLQSIKDRQGISGITIQQSRLLCKRNNRISDVFNRYVNWILDRCVKNKIGTVILPKWDGIKQNVKLGHVTNQKFVSIPYDKFRRKLAGKCKLGGITFDDTHTESYTSQCDALALDIIKKPPYGSSRRIKRGLYASATGISINADVNGALNHARNVVGDSFIREIVEYGRFTRPVRIRVQPNQPSPKYTHSVGASLVTPRSSPPVLTGGLSECG